MKERGTKSWVTVLVALMLIGFGTGGLIMALNKDTIHWNRGIQIGMRINEGKVVTREALADIAKNQTLKIVNSVGEVEVKNHSGNKVEVTYHGFETSTLEVTEGSNHVTIDAQVSPRNQTVNINGNKIRLVVKIPENFTGDLEVTNGVGEMTLVVGEHTRIDLNCGVGDVVFSPKVLETGAFNLSIGVGAMTVNLPKNADVFFTATTGVGNIKNRAKFDSYVEEGKIVSKSAEGTIGNGNARLKIKVGTGDLTLK